MHCIRHPYNYDSYGKAGHIKQLSNVLWHALQVAALVDGAGGEVDSEKPYAELW